jgi:D-alanyl-D-alanine carboxypeptidase
LLHKKESYIGIKTGVTTTAGACLASYLTIKDRSFVIIVLNAKKLSLRFADTELLRKWLIRKENMGESESKLECEAEMV